MASLPTNDTYRTNDGDPVDDENYINKDKLNKYKELINIKIQIHDKLEEFKKLLEGDDSNAKIENADLNELANHLNDFEKKSAILDESFDNPDKYSRSWHNLSLFQKALHPFQIIYKPFVKLFRWISNNNGRIKAGDPQHGGIKIGYLKELINQMISVTNITYKLEQKLVEPPQNSSYNDYFDSVSKDIDNIITSINNMSDENSSFYDLFPSGTTYTNDPELLKTHWLYYRDNQEEIPPILRIKQIDDIRTRILLPFMKERQNRLLEKGEMEAYDNMFSNPVLSEDVHQYLFNVITNKKELNQFEILHQKDNISSNIDDGISKINDLEFSSLLSKENSDPTGIYALFNMNSEGWQTLHEDPKKILTKIITGALNNSRINVSKIITNNLRLSENKKNTVKNNAITKLNELVSNDPEKKGKQYLG